MALGMRGVVGAVKKPSWKKRGRYSLWGAGGAAGTSQTGKRKEREGGSPESNPFATLGDEF